MSVGKDRSWILMGTLWRPCLWAVLWLAAVAGAGAFRVQTPEGFDKWSPERQATYINSIMTKEQVVQTQVAKERNDAIEAVNRQAGEQAQAAADARRAEIMALEAHDKGGTAGDGAEANANPIELFETSILVYLLLVALVAWGAFLFIRRAREVRMLRELDRPRGE